MAARRTNKSHVIRQTTGEKFPTSVVNTSPSPEETKDATPASASAGQAAPAAEDSPTSANAPRDQMLDFDDVEAADASPEPEPELVQENIFDLFSQDVTGSEAAAAQPAASPEPEDGLEEETEMEPEPEPEPPAPEDGPVEQAMEAEEEAPMEDETPEVQEQEQEEPEEGIDEEFIEAGAPNGSAPMLDSQFASEAEDAPAEGNVASAESTILMLNETQNEVLKAIGTREDVLAYARVAGIMAGKHTGEFIPSCPAEEVSECAVDIHPIAPAGGNVLRGWRPPRKDGRAGFFVQATCSGIGSSNVQTQALAAVSAASITIFDMVKESDTTVEITETRPLVEHPHANVEVVAEAPVDEEEAEELEELDDEEILTSPLPGGTGTGTPAPAVAFVGFQNSGKTTLVERVISNLTKRGLRIGSIKLHDSKGFEIDQPGRDSWRHAQAGSRHVGLISPDQYAEYASTSKEVPVQDLLTHYTDVDVVIVEGLKAPGIPSIVVARSGVDRIRGISSYDLIDDDTLAIACNEVTARGFRAQWSKMVQGDDDVPGNPNLPMEPPPFLDINDIPEIVSFVMDYLKAE